MKAMGLILILVATGGTAELAPSRLLADTAYRKEASSGKSRLVANLEAGKKQTVVTYGTSLTKVGAWGDQLATVLKQNFPGQVTFINSAKGGSNSNWGKKSFDKLVIQKKPDTVLIEFAINDAVERRKTTIDQSRKNLEDMIDRLLKAHPNCEIILQTMNPPVAHTGAQRPQIKDYYQMYRDVAKARGLLLIDHEPVWGKLLEENPALFLRYVPDGIHPVRKGALAIILPTTMKALGLKKGHPEHSTRTACWNYLFRSMDNPRDRDRRVSREEYSTFWGHHFRMQDANSDGNITATEYQPAGIFNTLDADKNGSVSLSEYQTSYAVHFQQLDADNDGLWILNETKKTK